MSIVIANNNQDGFYIISDTKITIHADKRIDNALLYNIQQYGMLKTIIFNGVAALSFAGNDLHIVNHLVKKLREIFEMPITPEDVYSTVESFFNSQVNLNPDGTHKCDFILATVQNETPCLYSFKDDFCIKNVKSCYIGNSDVYKRYKDFDLSKLASDFKCPEGYIGIELSASIKCTQNGDIKQDTDEMKKQIMRLKNIVDLGIKKNHKHKTDVGSPIIGVYFNTQRKQLEYFSDIIYEAHSIELSDGKPHKITINQYNNGEHYYIIPFKNYLGIIIYYPVINSSVIYFCTEDYKKNGIDDYYYLLLPIAYKGRITENDFYPIVADN